MRLENLSVREEVYKFYVCWSPRMLHMMSKDTLINIGSDSPRPNPLSTVYLEGHDIAVKLYYLCAL